MNRNDGVLAFPAYLHNALIFSSRFKFYNPGKEAEVQAIRKVFSNVPFVKMAWAVHLNCLIQEGKGIYEWEAEEQICPLRQNIKEYFNSSAYKEKVRSAMKEKIFSVDWECYNKKKSEKDEPNPIDS